MLFALYNVIVSAFIVIGDFFLSLLLFTLFVIIVVFAFCCRWYCCWLVDVFYLLLLFIFIDGLSLFSVANIVSIVVFVNCLFVAILVVHHCCLPVCCLLHLRRCRQL